MDEAAFTEWFEQVRSKNKAKTLGLSLSNHADDGRGSQLDCWDVPDQLDVGTIWTNLYDVARQDAELLRGVQTYAVSIVTAGATIARRLFQLEGGRVEGLMRKASNEEVIPVLVRHLENKERIMLQMVRGMVEGLGKEIDRLQSRNEKLERRDEERADVYEKLLSRQQERELRAKEHSHELQMKQEVVNGLRMVLPAAVNRMSGEKVLPEAPLSLNEQSLQALLESITEEQMQKLLSVMNPFQASAIMEMYNKYVLHQKQQKSATNSKGSANAGV